MYRLFIPIRLFILNNYINWMLFLPYVFTNIIKIIGVLIYVEIILLI